tara:strand:+ start:2928 stop:4154 length:1227 start_codon:yes stop_codon:yes gene_type:complete
MLNAQILEPPVGWNKVTLEQVAEFLDSRRIPIKEQDREKMHGPYPYYGASGIIDFVNDYIFDEDIILLAEDGANILNRATPIAFRVSGKSWVNNHAHVMRPRENTDIEFLTQYLDSIRYDAYNTGSAQPKLNREVCGLIPVLAPPYSEQRKIAAILRTWDEALEKLNALRALNIRRRIWLRTHLFTGKARLHGFTGEWRKVLLSDVLHEHGSKSTGTEEVYSVSVHKGLVNQVEHLGRSFSAASTDHYNRVLPGDIVYTKSPTGDFPLGIIKQSKIDREVIVSPLYGVYTPQSYALGVILDALFESPLAARNYLHPLVQKGAKNTIAVTNKQFLEGKLHLPMDPDEQAAIADVVNASHAELACLDAEIKALTDQKRGLMQKLLTGEWRVEVDTVEIPTNTKEAEHAGQ